MGEPPPEEVPPPGITAPTGVSKELVDRVRFARWRAWDQLAAGLPDGHVLSVELLHSRPGEAFAVFTVVAHHKAVQNIVGEPPGPGLVEANGPASPDAVAIGEPPPKQPTEPGVLALGNALLTAAFSDATRAIAQGAPASPSGIALGDPPPRAEPQPGIALGDPPPKQPPEPGITTPASLTTTPGIAAPASVATELVDRVRFARWQAWNRLASNLPDGHVLSVELLRAASGEAFAVFTVVKDHRAVQNVVGAIPAISAVDDPASPDAVALGQPPPREPPEPGVVALGQALLSSVFAAGEPAISRPRTDRARGEALR